MSIETGDSVLIYNSISLFQGSCLAVNQCLISIMDWTRANKLKLNPGKPEVLLGNCKSDKRIEDPISI